MCKIKEMIEFKINNIREIKTIKVIGLGILTSKYLLDPGTLLQTMVASQIQ